MHKIDVTLAGGNPCTISFQSDLIMMHSTFLSAQWNPDQVGIEVSHCQNCVKVGISATLPSVIPSEFFPNHHQSFYFSVDDYKPLLEFFKALRFPCHNPDPFGYDVQQ